MNRADFLSRRRLGVGGSDVAPICGLSPWGTALDVYNEKLELVPEKDETEAMHFGNVLEDVIAKEFARRTGVKVQRRNSMFRHPHHPELIANIDRRVVGENAILECKTSNAFAKDEWGECGTDHVPIQYLTQCQHYMHVTGLKRCFLAVLIGGSDFRWYNIPYQERLAKALEDKSLAFWNDHVLKEVPPPPMNEEDLKLVYSKGDLDAIVANDEIIQVMQRLNDTKLKAKAYSQVIDEAKLEVKKFMGDHSVLLHPEGHQLATWKKVESNRFDASAFKQMDPARHSEFMKTIATRTFLTKKPKE